MVDVLLVSQMFYPDIAATAKVMTDLVLDISENGYSVHVVSQNRAYNSPDTLFPNEDYLQGVKINRFSVPKISKNSLIGRVFLSYIVEKSSLRAVKKQDAKLYMAVSNPPNMALRIARYASRQGRPFIYILHDLYPDVLIKTAKLEASSRIAGHLRKMSEETFSLSSRIVVLGRDTADYLARVYGVSADKIRVITNWGPENDSKALSAKCIFRSNYHLEDNFVVLYSGNIGETAELDVLLDSAQLLEGMDDNIRFVIVGNGRHRDRIEKRAKELSNTIVLDFLPEEEYLQMISEVDCFFVSLKRDLYGNSVPSKTYYYLSAGKPIVGLLPENSEVALAIREDNLGFVCSDYDPETLKNMILKLKASPQLVKEISSSVVKCFEDNYSRKKVTRKYIDLIQEVVK